MTMTIEQFGQEIKKKYPQYKDVADAELGQSVIQKYPQYQRVLSADQPSKVSPAEAYENPKKDNFLTSLLKPATKTLATGIGAIEGLARTGAGLLNDGKLSDEERGKITEATTKERNFGVFGSSRPIGVSEDGQAGLTDATKTTGQKLGNFAREVGGTALELGSFAVPMPVGRAAVTAAKGLRPAIRGIGAAGAAGAVSGGMGAAGASIAEEDPLKGQNFAKFMARTGGGAALGGILGGGMSAIGRGIGATARKVGQGSLSQGAQGLGAEILGRTTGSGPAAIQEAFSNPNVIKFARQAGKEGPENLMNQALDDSYKALSLLRKKRGNEYSKQLEKIKLDKTQLDNLVQSARTGARNLLEEYDIGFRDGKLLNNLNFENSVIPEAQERTIQRAFNNVMSWTDNTPAGLDKLKKKLQNHLDSFPSTERGPGYNLVLQMKNSVDDALKTNVKGYAEMTSKYAEASNLIDEITKTLSLKDSATRDTTLRKLMSAMRQNNELRNDMLRTLSGASGEDILGKIAGATLSPWNPRGLVGALTPTTAGIGGISLAFISPQAIPMIAAFLATTSPRAMAELVSILSKASGNKLTQAMKVKIRNLIIQATNEEVIDRNNAVPATIPVSN